MAIKKKIQQVAIVLAGMLSLSMVTASALGDNIAYPPELIKCAYQGARFMCDPASLGKYFEQPQYDERVQKVKDGIYRFTVGWGVPFPGIFYNYVAIDDPKFSFSLLAPYGYPDLDSPDSAWKYEGDYTCRGSVKQCGMTNLPFSLMKILKRPTP